MVVKLPHPPYSPDLAPCDFFFYFQCPKKKHLAGRKYQTRKNFGSDIFQCLNSIPRKIIKLHLKIRLKTETLCIKWWWIFWSTEIIILALFVKHLGKLIIIIYVYSVVLCQDLSLLADIIVYMYIYFVQHNSHLYLAVTSSKRPFSDIPDDNPLYINMQKNDVYNRLPVAEQLLILKFQFDLN